MKSMALMQPYLFPYLGYFALIKSVDQFIFFDSPQYMKGGWINRNRILRADSGADYITVPLKKMPLKTAISEMQINDSIHWRMRILGKLTSYRRRAPYYDHVIDLLEDLFGRNHTMISDFNVDAAKLACNYIGIQTPMHIFSEMSLELGPVNESDEWALETSKCVGANVYINAPGGKSFYDREKYRRAGIDIKFLNLDLQPYDQKRDAFEPGLSVLDAMMFCTPNEIKALLAHVSYD